MYIVYYNISTIGIGIFQFQNKILKNLLFWIILYFFLLTIFFLYVVQFQMIWNFSIIYPTCLEEWIHRSTTILGVFSCKCDLVKCSCLVFRRVKKMIFVNSNANILKSAWWKFLKFFPHILKLVYYKILRLHVSKNVFFQNFGACTRNGSFGAFLVKT